MSKKSFLESLIVYDHFEAYGGAENVTQLLSKHIPNSAVLTAWINQSMLSYSSSNVINLACDYKRAFFPSMALASRFIKGFDMPGSLKNLLLTGVYSPLALLSENINRTDARKIVYFHTFPSFIDKELSKLVAERGLLPGLGFKIFVMWYMKKLRQALGAADVVFSNSDFVRRKFQSVGIQSEVLYPPADIAQFSHAPSDGYYLSTSRLEPNKNVELLLEAFSELPDHRLVVVGGGSLAPMLKAKYKYCNNITFIGWKLPEELPPFYAKCHALIYLSESEYFGLSAVEANAAGKAVIAANAGGLKEIINAPEYGVRLSVPIGKDALKKALVDVSKQTENTEIIIARNNNAQRFSTDAFLRRINACLEQ